LLLVSRASMALRVSKWLGVLDGFSTSSILPWKRSFLSLSKIKTCGVDTGPFCFEAISFSPSYSYGKLKWLSLARTFISSKESPTSLQPNSS
jgi:hypothetical protein